MNKTQMEKPKMVKPKMEKPQKVKPQKRPLKERIITAFSTKKERKKLAKKGVRIVLKIFLYTFMVGLTFIILYPLLLQLAVAFRRPVDVNDPEVLWVPKVFSTENFKIAAIALKYWKALGNTLLNSTIIALLQVASTAVAGYAFARLHFKGSKFLFTLALFTIIVPQTMISLPMKIQLTEMGLIGKKYVLYLMSGLGMGIKSGIFIYLFRQFFKGIPVELEEAAYMDGASPIGVFFRVMLPNVKSGIITVALLAFVWQWNDFYFTNLFFVNNQADIYTLSTQQQAIIYGLESAVKEAKIWELMGQDITSNVLFKSMIVNTAGIMVMLPLLIIYFFVQKLFVQGIERSGIVG